MGLQTSMYLSDDLEAAWLAAKARGETMAGVFRRGLAAPDPSAAAVAQAVSTAIGQISTETEEAVARGFARALRDLQSGSAF